MLFLAVWSGLAWWLLAEQGWSASELWTVAGLGLGYLVGGVVTAAAFVMQVARSRNLHQRHRPVRRYGSTPRMLPALVTGRIRVRR